MASTTCAYCGRLSHMTHKWSGFARAGHSGVLQGVATCDQCGRASVGSRMLSMSEQPYESQEKFQESDDLRWHPTKIVTADFPDVPEHIARAAKEAHECDVIGAKMAAILMARTVVEATAKNKGITTGNLFSKIDQLAKAEHIRKGTKEAAHEIRHLGNDMAHGDIETLPTKDDVRDVLDLMDEVLNEVFQGPAKTARLLSRRQDQNSAETEA